MLSKLNTAMGTIVAIGLVIAGLWVWSSAFRLVEDTPRPVLAMWALRGAAIAALAGAQVLGMTFIVDAIYDRDRGSEIMRLTAGLVCTTALVIALGLGLMSM